MFQATIDTFLSCPSKASDALLNVSTFSCPICRQEITTSTEHDFNSHLDKCLGQDNELLRKQKSKNSKSEEHFYKCPICEQQIKVSADNDDLNLHLDECISNETKVTKPSEEIELVKTESAKIASHSKFQSDKKTEANFFGRTEKSNVAIPLNPKVASHDSNSSEIESDQKTETNFFGKTQKAKISPPENAKTDSNFFGRKQNQNFPKSSIQNEAGADFSGHEESEASCPICGLAVAECSMNSHIDECLNKETIDNLRREQSSDDREKTKKRKIETRHKPDGKRFKAPKNKSILNYFQSK